MITISLIGEQSIPNLLPIRYQPPDAVMLVHTDLTKAAAERLARLLPDGCEAIPCLVSAYDIQEIARTLQSLIKERDWPAADLLFNLTGGTKAMALAAFLAAADCRAPFLYLQSEGRKTRLYRYEFNSAGMPQVSDDRILPALITIDDYLRAHVNDYQILGPSEKSGGLFERVIDEALQSVVDEVVAGVRLSTTIEIDLVVRCENQVGIIEAKTGGQAAKKSAIDQLSTAGGREYLGIYTQKMLAVDRRWEKDQSNLKELAAARNIALIELPSFRDGQALSPQDVECLRSTVCKQLGKASASSLLVGKGAGAS
jgi:hypothetical protein